MRGRRRRLGGAEVEGGRKAGGSGLGRVLKRRDVLYEEGLWKPISGTPLCVVCFHGEKEEEESCRALREGWRITRLDAF